LQDSAPSIESESTLRHFTLQEYIVHASLFILTFLSTTFAGVLWLNKDPLELGNFPAGLPYAALILLMLSSHEFGHFFAARCHRVSSTLPYFIPFFIPVQALFGLFPFGTLGAVIRLRSTIPSRKVIFDIGAAGPITGFIVSFAILAVGFATLPPIDYLYSIHPEYAQLSTIPEVGLTFGKTLFYTLAGSTFAHPGAFIPPMNEIYHYPFLCVGWFGMLVTSMNLIPIGQLDGGHISYAMFGNRHHLIGQVYLIILVVLGTAGLLPLFGIPFDYGWAGWLFWALLLTMSIKVFRFARPPLHDETPLDSTRMIIGWICFLIFIGCFSPVPAHY